MAVRQPHARIDSPRRPTWQSRYHGVRMTPQQFLALPEQKPYLEYVHGVVLQKPMANAAHGRVAVEVATELRLYTRKHGGHVGVEVRSAVGAGPDYRLPDVSYWAPIDRRVTTPSRHSPSRFARRGRPRLNCARSADSSAPTASTPVGLSTRMPAQRKCLGPATMARCLRTMGR